MDADTFWKEHAGSADSYRTVCGSPIDSSQADLCQQWRSAQSAEQIAAYTLVGLFVSVVGLGGLLWTVYLTNKATRAATHATEAAIRSADAAEQAYLSERRPWLRLKLRQVLWVRIDRDNGAGLGASFKVKCLNGNPADNVRISFKAFKMPHRGSLARSEIAEIAATLEKPGLLDDRIGSVAMPGRWVRADRHGNVIWREADRAAEHRSFRIAIVAVVAYQAVGGTTVYHTAETYFVAHTDKDETRGFFFETGEQQTFVTSRLEAGHSPVGGHAT